MTDRCWGGLPWLDHGYRVNVRCDEPVVPMTRYCAEHLIAHTTSPAGGEPDGRLVGVAPTPT